ncbi:hypothetical protein [Rhodococcus sp. BH5]|uniref:hypothetical protein n=1 Tax=Rhodococcus sp. BH5 TaxID=2871702 RepID=UPI0022CDA01E|nr:hypothetical protein [Rhodococcus sp. BH5]MCZ9635049.1 hypothetical protein [Rhodococcus sp. BH5]
MALFTRRTSAASTPDLENTPAPTLESQDAVDSGRRAPVVAGAAGGVGTSVIAALIGGIDEGVVAAGRGADVLVARWDVPGCIAAGAALARMHDAAAYPALVLVADSPRPRPAEAKVLARILRGLVCEVVTVDWCEQLRMTTDPVAEITRAATLFDAPAKSLTRWVRPWKAVRMIVLAVVAERLEPGWSAEAAPSASTGFAVPDGASTAPVSAPRSQSRRGRHSAALSASTPSAESTDPGALA